MFNRPDIERSEWVWLCWKFCSKSINQSVLRLFALTAVRYVAVVVAGAIRMEFVKPFCNCKCVPTAIDWTILNVYSEVKYRFWTVNSHVGSDNYLKKHTHMHWQFMASNWNETPTTHFDKHIFAKKGDKTTLIQRKSMISTRSDLTQKKISVSEKTLNRLDIVVIFF